MRLTGSQDGCETALVGKGEPGAAFSAVLINPYELGRQPFALAEAAAWLKQEGVTVYCLDLSLQKLDPAVLSEARLVYIYLGMHTATRIALAALPRIRAMAPIAHFCAYGLYAPMNHKLLRDYGINTVLGGECEPEMAMLAHRLMMNKQVEGSIAVSIDKIRFLTPDRSGLPPLKRYAHLRLPDGTTRVTGFVDTSRGCKHLCRHCPVVPVYQGRFRIVPLDVVVADIRQQMAAGAEHLSFGDPDFLNGPTHALKVVRALHEKFPSVTYDATIKVEHILRHADLLPELQRTGCLFIISAVEAVDDQILNYLDKGHNSGDFNRAESLLREANIAMVPTFVAFTPWTTLEGYIKLLRRLVELQLVENVPPIQLSIRLLIPEGSHLLKVSGFRDLIEDFDPVFLGYPWKHRDPRVDALQHNVQTWVEAAEGRNLSRRIIFERIWWMAHQAINKESPELPAGVIGEAVPHLSEPWYCCAEPTDEQLLSF